MAHYRLEYLGMFPPLSRDTYKIDPNKQVQDVAHDFVKHERIFARHLTLLRGYQAKLTQMTAREHNPIAEILTTAFPGDMFMSHGIISTAIEHFWTNGTLNTNNVVTCATVLSHIFANANRLTEFLDYSENLIRTDNICWKMSKDPKFSETVLTLLEVQNPQNWDTFDIREKLSDLLIVPVMHMLNYGAYFTYLHGHMVNAQGVNQQVMNTFLDCYNVITGFADSIPKICEDTNTLRELENVQNQIENLPEPLVDNPNDDTNLGFVRTDLRHFGRLHTFGEVYITDGTPEEKEDKKRFLLIMDELLLVCTVKGPQQRNLSYNFQYCEELAGIDITGQDQAELQLRIRCRTGGKQINMAITDNYIESPMQAEVDAVNAVRDHRDKTRLALAAGHNIRPTTFKLGLKCSRCDKVISGSFMQGYKCVNGGPQHPCGSIFHRDCISAGLPACTHTGSTPNPSRALEPWVAGDMSDSSMAVILPMLPAGTFAFRGDVNNSSPARPFHLNISIPCMVKGVQKDYTISVEHRMMRQLTGGFAITTLPLQLNDAYVSLSGFADLKAIYEHFKNNTTVNFGSKENPYHGPLRFPWWESIRRILRKNGCMYYDWMSPEMPIVPLLSLRIYKL